MNISFAKEVGILHYIRKRLLWRLGKAPQKIMLPTGCMFPLPSDKFFASDVFVTSANVDWNSEYILAAFLKSFPEKREFLDVGAHMGYYSSLLSPLCSHVFAFEPDLRNIPYLGETAKHLSNLTVVVKAVSDRNGTVGFSDSDESSVSHILATSNPGSPKGSTLVDCTTIDDFVTQEVIRPIAVKVDIEGFDILALRGAVETARTHQPVFLVEYNLEDGRPNTWEGLDHFLKNTGYTIYAVTRQPKSTFDYAYTFKGYDITELSGLSVKMIFLIPKSSEMWFDNLAATIGHWDREALRPHSVAAFLSKFDPRQSA